MIRRLFRVLGDELSATLRRQVVASVLSAILQGVGFALLVPLLRALLAGDTATAWRWMAVETGVVVAFTAVEYVGQMAGYEAGTTLSKALTRRLGDHIAALPLGWFTADRVGRVGRLTGTGIVSIMGVPAHLLRQVIVGVVTPLTVMVLMFVFEWRIAVAALAAAPVVWLVARWSSSRVQRVEHVTDAAGAEASARVVEFSQTQAVLRAFGRSREGFALLDDALVGQRDAGRRLLTSAVPGLIGFTLIVQTAFVVILLLGTYLALGGEVAVPELIALLVLAVRYVEPMLMAGEIGSALRIAQNDLNRVDDVLATAPLPEPDDPATVADADVEFDGVTFGYEADTPVLRDVSFRVPARTMTAIVGPSGSGKTTVTRLIARFFDVDAGVVRVGGEDVRDLTTEQLMGELSLVFQDVYLFEGTIADNIRVGDPDADDDAVREAARLARVDEVVDRLPQGWDTQVGEGGTRLSGGERQRVSIARAILKDTPIVLLDEATAALDPENEAAVQDALTALTADRTLLVIAHRLQTVTAADQIVVLDEGRVAELGTHDELLARGGRYATFWRERSRAAGWRLAGADEAAR